MESRMLNGLFRFCLAGLLITVGGFAPAQLPTSLRTLSLRSTASCGSKPRMTASVPVRSEIEDAKRALLVAAGNGNRGFSFTSADRSLLIESVRRLEAATAKATAVAGDEDDVAATMDSDECSCDMLQGKWKLIGTTALDVLSLGGLPGIQPGAIYQNVDFAKDSDSFGAELEVNNIVEFQPQGVALLGAVIGNTDSVLQLTVKAAGKLESSDTGSCKRVDLSFLTSTIQPKSLLGQDVSALPPLSVPLQPPQALQDAGRSLGSAGTLVTTFLDDELRIGRGVAPASFNLGSDLYSETSDNNIFVLWREE